MKKITFSPDFKKKLKVLAKKDEKLFFKIHKKLKLFADNSEHPSLRVHKLKGKLKDTKSLSVTMGFRLIFLEDTKYYFYDMGTHKEVYG
ncbi:MAG: type II toxin-antitoxin system mRNA interferase toxin, RelE/StbE family [Patescibacteria group bacterium]